VNDQTIGALFAVTIFEIPLIILSWLLIRSALIKINRIRSSIYSEHDRKKDFNKLILLSIILLILFILIMIPIIIVVFPNILLSLPKPVLLFIAFPLLIIYVPIYLSFFAFRMRKDVAGDDGSASQFIKQLEEYFYEMLEIGQQKK